MNITFIFISLNLIITSYQQMLMPFRDFGARNFYKLISGHLLYGISRKIYIRHPIGWIEPDWPTPITRSITLSEWEFKRLNFEIRVFNFHNNFTIYRSWRKDEKTFEFLLNFNETTEIRSVYSQVLDIFYNGLRIG